MAKPQHKQEESEEELEELEDEKETKKIESGDSSFDDGELDENIDKWEENLPPEGSESEEIY